MLWLSKPYNQNIQDWNFCGFTGLQPGTEANQPLQTSSINLKFHVINSFEKRLIKNDSARTITISIYVCSPKITGFKVINPATLGTYPTVSLQTAAMIDPQTSWRHALEDDFKNQINPSNIVPETLFEKPDRTPGWNKLFFL